MFTSNFRTLCWADEPFPPSPPGFGFAFGAGGWEAMLRWTVRVIIKMNRHGFKGCVILLLWSGGGWKLAWFLFCFSVVQAIDT